MENTVQKIPFLRPTVALAFGVFMGSILDFQIYLTIAISTFLFICTFFIYKKFSYRVSSLFGISIHFLFIALGILVFEIYNQKPHFYTDGVFSATVLEKPQEKNNSFKSVILLSSVKKDTGNIKSVEKLLVYFNKTDGVQQLSAGDIILFSASPQIIKNFGNPYEFDYKKYLERKKIYRQVYLNSNQWQSTGINTAPSLVLQAEQFREKLLNIYRNQKFEKNELEILSALTLGYKRELDPETKRIFSNSGAMHVLAVSGLHVGIVFWVISILFGFLRNQNTGRIFFIFITIVVLWVYAFITGLSPSVMRAATMFSIFVVGENINRKSNSYNSLAASALFLLLINPNNLFEVGFQLSYSAVFGILFFQPKFSKLFRIKNKILKFIWSLITISIAAQIATFPLTSFYFNQFPTYFLLTNLVVIPAAMLLIPLGISLLVFSKIPIMSSLISKTLQLVISFCYNILSQIEQFPSSVQEISIQPIQLFFIIGIFIALLLFLKSKRPNFIKIGLVFILTLSIYTLHNNIKQSKSNEIIVYNTPNNFIIHLISGRSSYILSDFEPDDSLQILTTTKKTNIKKNLQQSIILSPQDSFKNQHLLLKDGFLIFNGKTIVIDKSFTNLNQIISPNFIINPKQLNHAENCISAHSTIITNKRLKTNLKPFPNTIFQIPFQGAFQENW